MYFKSLKLSKNNILNFFFLLYLICFSSYNLQKGFDDYIIKIIPIVLMFLTLAFNYKKIKISKLLKWFFAFWFFYILSFFWTRNNHYTQLLLPNIVYLLPAVFCLQYLVNDEKDINVIIKLVIISLAYSLFLILIRGGIGQLGSQRLGSAIGLSSNAVGMRLAIGSTLLLYLVHNESKNKVLNIIMLILFVLFGLLTGSRKAAIMIIMLIVSYEILTSKGIKVFFKFIAMLLFSIVIIYFIFNNKYLYNVLGYRFENMINQLQNVSQSDGSVTERNYYMEKAMELFHKNSIIGVGGNGFAAHMEYINYKHIAYSHNNFTELLATLGIIGFVIYYSAWFIVLYKLIKEYKKSKSNLALLFIVTIGIWCIMDYGNVSYYDLFHILLLSIASRYIEFTEKGNKKVKIKGNKISKL